MGGHSCLHATYTTRRWSEESLKGGYQVRHRSFKLSDTQALGVFSEILSVSYLTERWTLYKLGSANGFQQLSNTRRISFLNPWSQSTCLLCISTRNFEAGFLAFVPRHRFSLHEYILQHHSGYSCHLQNFACHGES